MRVTHPEVASDPPPAHNPPSVCISRSHLAFLERSNEEDYAAGRIGYETWVRFSDHAERCWECPLLENGVHGDMFEECRVRLLRFFISAKRDDAERLVKARDPLSS